MTYQELYDQIGALTPEQRQAQITIDPQNERALLTVSGINVQQENAYVHEDDFEDFRMESDLPTEERERDEFKLIWPKGSLWLLAEEMAAAVENQQA